MDIEFKGDTRYHWEKSEEEKTDSRNLSLMPDSAEIEVECPHGCDGFCSLEICPICESTGWVKISKLMQISAPNPKLRNSEKG